MTSEERRAARYERRMQKRLLKKQKVNEAIGTYEDVFSYANLYEAYKHCRKSVSWKASVQKFVINAPLSVKKIYDELMSFKYEPPAFSEFYINIRGGKIRQIKSTTVADRVVQCTMCTNALLPALERTFIMDNGASLKKKGYHYSIRRLELNLRRHYHHYGNSGYILLFDFSDYFASIPHGLLKNIIRNEIFDEKLIKLLDIYLSKSEGEGLPIGSHISQVLSLAAANRLDHHIKEVMRIKGYGRYMDDGYIIHHSKEYLKEILERLKQICEELGLKLNLKKTHIVKLSRGFSWTKIKFNLTNTGKIIKRMSRIAISRRRRALKRMHIKYLEGKIKYEDILNCWQSWKYGYAARFKSYRTVQNLQRLFDELFKEERSQRLCI